MRLAVLLASLLVVACAHSAATESAQKPTDQSASVHGFVRDPAGQVLAGVTIVFVGHEGELGDITDDVGAYTILGLAPGDYRVLAFYGNAKLELKASVVANTRTNFDIVLDAKSRGSTPYPTVDVHSVSAR